jgi:hypothetical protein
MSEEGYQSIELEKAEIFKKESILEDGVIEEIAQSVERKYIGYQSIHAEEDEEFEKEYGFPPVPVNDFK